MRVGDRVRLRPRQGGDVFDIALAGQIATIEALEQDYEGKVHVCVVLDDDPGRDLGLLRQPGHRFFFDVGRSRAAATGSSRRRRKRLRSRASWSQGSATSSWATTPSGSRSLGGLRERALPADVRVGDFGIRGFDLAYALQDGYETTILVDAYPRGDEPGTLYVVEPDLSALGADQAEGADVDAHGMDPVKILRLAASMGGPLKRVLLVGCEPATLGPEEGQMGLSEPVARAVTEAVNLVESVINRVLAGEWPGSEHTERLTD